MFMSITKGPQGLREDEILCAFSWTAVPDKGDAHPAGMAYEGATAGADVVFVLSRTALKGGHVLASQPVAWPAGPALVRIDEVCFPVGAVAHRHTHSGAGFRHLVRGSLRIETAGHTQVMSVGDSWFEPTQTPVRAVAQHDHGVTSFVRCMIVPPEFEGKTTFQLANPADADLPRLQVTHRHIDHPIQVEAG